MRDSTAPAPYHGSEIAVVGMACRFPKAGNLDEYWLLLAGGVEAITFFSDEELSAEGIDRELLDDPHYVKAAPILDDVELFDAAYFDYSPREAELMDPQQRLFLECAVEALDNAGYGAGLEKGTVGVFAGGKMSTYVFNIHSNPELARSLDKIEIGLGNDIALLAMRTSYKLDLKGPSYFVQSACSTSLAAIHLACQSLLIDECQMALAGAVAIDVPYKCGYLYREGSLASPDGHVRAFDAKAGGTLFGSGLGIVVLKRLEDALADGDRIRAVIKGSAINNDGATKANFTAPSAEGEARVVLEALINAEVRPESISYVEAHGTGTQLGDPIEIRALTRAYCAGTDARGFCAIGSVKTNLGHLDAAAGISGFIKTVLALERRQLPPSLHFEEPNPEIDFAASPFRVQTELTEWLAPAGGGPRRAAVSAFGFGGTNAHVIVEEAPPAEKSGASRPWQLLLLSGRSEPTVEATSQRLATHLRQNPDLDLADVAFTLQVGRRSFRHRRALVATDLGEAADALAAGGSSAPALAERPVAFLFSGQGSQHPNMGRELYEGEPTFRRHLDESAEILRPLVGRDLREVLYPPPGGEEQAAGELRRTALAQPALFAVEHALAALWREWGVVPSAMIGHSIGEYVAACLAGVFSLTDALAVVAARGRLMQEMPEGAMLAVTLAEDEVLPLLEEGLSVASVNTDRRTVVSGPREAVDALARRLAAEGVDSRALHTSHAFHSAMMEPALERFRAEVEKVGLRAPEIPFVSNVTGTWITAEEATDPGYWVAHLRRPVRFAAGLEALREDPTRLLLEMGPGNTLATFARETAKPGAEDAAPIASSLPHPRDRRSQPAFLLAAVGRLWTAGVEVDSAGFYAHQRRHRVALPSYPFERQSYWIERQALVEAGARASGRIRKIHDVDRWFHVPSWKVSLPPGAWISAPPVEKRRWLLFADGSQLSRAVAERLVGEEVLTVRAGAAYRRSGAAAVIDPRQSSDYARLIRDFGPPDAIVHLWNVADDGAASGPELFGRAQDVGYYSLLFLAQGLAALEIEEPPPVRLVVATSRLYDMSGAEPTRPEKSTLLGPAMVIPQEQRNVSCRVVDVVPGALAVGELAEQILAEVTAEDDDLVVVWRGQRRWAQAYDPVALAPVEGLGRLRESGVYLLVGGLGNVGMLLAEHLAKTARARLVLLGRSPFPPPQEWMEYLEKAEDDDFRAGRIRRLMAMQEEAGTEVLVLSADVADREQMRRVVDTVEQSFGTLHGVIHAAGVLTGDSVYRLATEIGREASEVQFAAKAHGLYALEEVLADRHLDFCLLLSSNAATLGGLGFVAYSAANAFMDAFALDRARSTGTRWISSNWDEWPLEGERLVQTSMSEFSMTREESVDAFARVLGAPLPGQVIVATGDFEARRDLWIRRGGEPAATTELHVRPQLNVHYEEPQSDLERQIAEVWQGALGIEQIGRLDNFFDVGGHSLIATQIVSRLRGLLGIELPIKTFFEVPTVAELAEHVEMMRWAVQGAAATVSGAADDREEGEL